MWVRKIIAISDRVLVQDDFLRQVEKLAKAKIDAFVLREKDLSEYEYYDLAKEVLKICTKYKITCFLHGYLTPTLKLEHKYFQASLALLRKESNIAKYFHILGTSVHSKEELLEAINYKVNHAFVGHIFKSSCKPNLKPYGIELLKDLLSFSSIPLYAIGGINAENIKLFKNINIAGVCMREALMRESNPKKYLALCKKEFV
ncbi:thiamine phosphate synthase [Campylobacter upsaliensis]|uniref:thiamine phosphate synthase n=1 Tax=Campylobacter upsaliensis TaxID=28080 RepID=UPI0012820D14|nr:thiamine phosphate synthase [Campylobacter upsaliensis]EAH8207713.1 thiamine phosphate synthase [Campylobacter upsaliensis]EAI5601664.1 thiamine phosphate synthase [Campylobacter upsaliensis]EAJ7130648.1 thiamine phosphate synthase [Campylobacter upsaliensis]EAK0459251.1 thiamine phosphate synthase [Campylobacter upsaliensis]EAK6956202.1 thiamine phosphate synthase [Campylobacter upsaliensis]